MYLILGWKLFIYSKECALYILYNNISSMNWILRWPLLVLNLKLHKFNIHFDWVAKIRWKITIRYKRNYEEILVDDWWHGTSQKDFTLAFPVEYWQWFEKQTYYICNSRGSEDCLFHGVMDCINWKIIFSKSWILWKNVILLHKCENQTWCNIWDSDKLNMIMNYKMKCDHSHQTKHNIKYSLELCYFTNF